MSTFTSRALAGGQASVPCATDGRIHGAAALDLNLHVGPGFPLLTQQVVLSELTPSAVVAKNVIVLLQHPQGHISRMFQIVYVLEDTGERYNGFTSLKQKITCWQVIINLSLCLKYQ